MSYRGRMRYTPWADVMNTDLFMSEAEGEGRTSETGGRTSMHAQRESNWNENDSFLLVQACAEVESIKNRTSTSK